MIPAIKPLAATLAAAALALLGAAPALAGFQTIAGGTYFVKNNSQAELSCSISSDGKSWSPWFALKPAQQWSRQAGSPRVTIRCQEPVAAAYPLKPGERYSFLRDPATGKVALKAITTTP